MSSRWLWAILSPLALLFASSCTRKTAAADDPVWRGLELQRTELAQKIQLAEFKIQQMDARRTKGADLPLTAAKLAEHRLALEQYRDQLKEWIPAIESDLATARVTRLAETRRMAEGLEFASLTTRQGNTFENVKVVEVGDDGAKIRHSAGFARLRVEDLTPEMRDRLGLDEDLQHLAVQRIDADQNAYHQQMDQALASSKFQAAPATRPTTSNPFRTVGRVDYSRASGLSRPIGLGASANPEYRRTYRIWRYGTSHSYRYYSYSW